MSPMLLRALSLPCHLLASNRHSCGCTITAKFACAINPTLAMNFKILAWSFILIQSAMALPISIHERELLASRTDTKGKDQCAEELKFSEGDEVAKLSVDAGEKKKKRKEKKSWE
ncbi:uncharacterized protein FOBCDRAFT_204443 [Fusarium oxysporum Fo47]|uniref:uncharacterized protein n=1 Tax=Fusarium oxysporum Fo47 TaxID=660027 RepID=UPI0028699583|nr:uncharacterized protein FOBCDRAFT_204443 [Fusarium oxysporum Fo47]WJG35832.1 hypothetical protein FOBCDRAFT_204443 [Fusarium oxysporum Fo47]